MVAPVDETVRRPHDGATVVAKATGSSRGVRPERRTPGAEQLIDPGVVDSGGEELVAHSAHEPRVEIENLPRTAPSVHRRAHDPQRAGRDVAVVPIAVR